MPYEESADDRVRPPSELPGQVGRLLQAARAKARMTQARLAQHAGSTQQWLSRVERGGVDLRLSDAERLFAAAHVRLIVHAAAATGEPVADPDLLGDDCHTTDERAAVLESELPSVGYALKRFSTVPHVIGGRCAALAQGLPVRPYRLDLIVAEADVEAATGAVAMVAAMRWSDRLQDFMSFDADVARPGERRGRVATRRPMSRAGDEHEPGPAAG
jgi:transcriptional regulator with XRE-family HTH domain